MQAIKYSVNINERGEINLPKLPLKNGTQIEVIILIPDDDKETEEWAQFSVEAFAEDWDSPEDAIYDNWEEAYGLHKR